MFWSFCSFSVSDALLDPLRNASSFFNEPSDFLVSVFDLFIFVVLRPRHVSCFLCLLCCCCNTNPRPQLSVEVPSYDFDALFGFRVLLDCSVCSFDVMMVRVSRVGKVHTHQQHTLFVDCDEGCFGSFIDVVCPIDSFTPLLVQQYSNSVLVLGCSGTHECVLQSSTHECTCAHSVMIVERLLLLCSPKDPVGRARRKDTGKSSNISGVGKVHDAHHDEPIRGNSSCCRYWV